MDSFVTQSIIHVHNIIILHLFLDFVSKWLFCFHNVRYMYQGVCELIYVGNKGTCDAISFILLQS